MRTHSPVRRTSALLLAGCNRQIMYRLAVLFLALPGSISCGETRPQPSSGETETGADVSNSFTGDGRVPSTDGSDATGLTLCSPTIEVCEFRSDIGCPPSLPNAGDTCDPSLVLCHYCPAEWNY